MAIWRSVRLVFQKSLWQANHYSISGNLSILGIYRSIYRLWQLQFFWEMEIKLEFMKLLEIFFVIAISLDSETLETNKQTKALRNSITSQLSLVLTARPLFKVCLFITVENTVTKVISFYVRYFVYKQYSFLSWWLFP